MPFQTLTKNLKWSLHQVYHDLFEVVNTLRSGRQKEKILAMYLILTNILPHNRSSTDQMQLVMLCREQDYKHFGQGLFVSLFKYLKDLELNGVTLPDSQPCKGTLYAIAGDNLVSHNIGSSQNLHFCRHSEIDQKTSLADPLAKGHAHHSHIRNTLRIWVIMWNLFPQTPCFKRGKKNHLCWIESVYRPILYIWVMMQKKSSEVNQGAGLSLSTPT